MLVVQESRDLSALVARETGVRHESPQVILFRGGEVAWSASHGAIDRGSLGAALLGFLS